ncbi:hypothetical protein GCM10011505_45130 [Tistrella bauzanensis]|uniref:Macro domain-containing protein n=1 Tax=Tistrella bauzanensis TaxID=657419 RepID=A0ABQ1J5I5_9PROT|nr:macro domain-containing protein [Tistrella bauzanensis]GGB59327.1 hypothetical protein GCM10011505_45130 [Tistrella bauzanensis]
MMRFTQGNLLDARVDALVNTVNTVGVMGKGIALMFKEAFPENFEAYAAACKRGEVRVGRMFVTERHALIGPRWIINFPTKTHWRHPSRIAWIGDGLDDLRRAIIDRKIRSIAIPPLGSGNGGLAWSAVRPLIESGLGDLPDVDIVVYEPVAAYQNVMKRSGVEGLTPARALIVDLVRRYWALGMDCSILEIQKLAYFLERSIENAGLDNPLRLRFTAHRYGPYAPPLGHLLDTLDGSYLHAEKRLADAGPYDLIWADESRRDVVDAYLRSAAKPYLPALKATVDLIDGFESALGLELLATVHWLVDREDVALDVAAIREALAHWPSPDKGAAARKLRLFDDRLIGLAIARFERVAAA